MEFPYRPELVQQAGVGFDAVVAKIQARDFVVRTPPERKICKECDLRTYCVTHGTVA
jgi:CRISPR/Cas system-associated exonuclease Cas4 (RecB family)